MKILNIKGDYFFKKYKFQSLNIYQTLKEMILFLFDICIIYVMIINNNNK